MAYFHGLCHRYWVLRYIGVVLELRKLDFMGLKDQFDFIKANFRGLITKMGYFRPILASRTHLWPIFMDCAIGIVP